MAINRNAWTNGGADNSWDTNANWSDGGKPNASDDVVLTGSPGHITAGVGGESAILLQSLIAERGSNVNVGSAGLLLDIQTPLFRHDGLGTMYYKHNGTGSSDQVLVDSDNVTLALAMDIVATGLDRLNITKGYVELLGLTAGGITDCELSFRNNPGTDATLVVDAGAANVAITTMLQHAGISTFNNAAGVTGTFFMAGGTCTFNTGPITSLKQVGGTFYMNTTTTLTNAVVLAGTLDMTRRKVAKTITNLWLGPSAVLMRDEYYDTVNNIRYLGGKKG